MAKSPAAKPSRKKTTPASPARPIAEPLDPQLLRRVIVENVYPEIDGGRFPVKRTLGEQVIVSADVYTDGHDMIAAALLYRRAGDVAWTEVPMAAAGNDRWTAVFPVTALGRYEYTVEGWID